MAYCGHCGAELTTGALRCARCGQAAPGGGGSTASAKRGGPLLLILLPVGCLAVVAFIGIIAAILIPNFLDALQKAKTKRTIADMRTLGTAWMEWTGAEDLIPSVGVDDGLIDLAALGPPATVADLASLLGPDYLPTPIELDGWKNPLELRILLGEDGTASLLIRSAGRDRIWQSESYQVGPFVPGDYDQDLVWMDGFFVRWPESPAGP